MTEVEWLAGTDPMPMLEFLRGKASDRKLRLFGIGCCRRIWHTLTDDRSRKAIEKAEEYAEGRISQEELSAAQAEADRAIWPWVNRQGGTPGQSWKMQAATTAAKSVARPSDYPHKLTEAIMEAARRALLAEFGELYAAAVGQTYQCGLIRDIFGNPFRPVSADPDWLTSTAVALAKTIYADRAFDRLPILADALEDAGCDNADILAHCRGDGPHVRGCWAVDLVLGKE